MKLTDCKVLTFDCYGTLIDWETGMIKGLAPLLSKVERKVPRNEILQAHARHESTQQTWTPGMRYSELLAIVYKRLAEEWGVAVTPDECAAYGQSIKQWPAFLDSPDALQYLKKHYKLAILSNVVDVLPKLKLMDYRTCCFSRDCGINSSCLLSRRSASLTLPPPQVDAPTCECLSLH